MYSQLNQKDFEEVFKNNVKSKPYTLSLKTLFSERRSAKINYSPYYQRNYVWDNSKATFFIESILLGTDIPPLIFFNTGSNIEVIDGRQRYETIKKFKNGELKLNSNGLTKLSQLKNKLFFDLDHEIQEIFDDTKIRIFEFEVLNEPRLEVLLEDKIKKEIFRRYNSGITPLNTAEIDNAAYDADQLTIYLKNKFSKDNDFNQKIRNLFLSKTAKEDFSSILQFLRKSLVLTSFPINTYARGINRKEIMALLYDFKSENDSSPEETANRLIFCLNKTIELIDSLNIDSNKYINECFLWAISILFEEKRDINLIFSERNIDAIRNHIYRQREIFFDNNSHYYASILARYESISDLFRSLTGFDFSLFIKKSDFKEEIKKIAQSEQEARLKLDELSSLRVQKPEPSLIPIEEIVTELDSHRYMIRPSYQRSEKININKASAIIESILLDISLPPLFIFKNENSIKEVIDGQQRLLSIIGFMGKKYRDENGDSVYPILSKFKLSRLKILKEINGLTFENLHQTQKDKLYDSMLNIIEINSLFNNNFDPVDLFIRLNNKPYPIKENSFEMWNSFMDRDIIEKIKKLTKENVEWFYIKSNNSNNSSDRMLNEELVTLLSYNLYNSNFRADYKSLAFHLRDKKVTCKISDKKDVSVLLEKMLININLKNDFLGAISEIENIILLIKMKLNAESEKESLNDLFGIGAGKRSLADFYILFQIMQRLTNERKKSIPFTELNQIFNFVKNKLSNPNISETKQQSFFESLLDKVSI